MREAKRRRRTRALPALIAVVVLAGGGTYALTRSDGDDPDR